MMQNKLTGIYNMVNKGTITHNEILNMFKDLVDPSLQWTNIITDEQNKILRSQRSNCQLDTNKLCSLYPDIPDIHTSVKRCVENIQSQYTKTPFHL